MPRHVPRRSISGAGSRTLQPYILFPGLVAEYAIALWLVVADVNVERWKERAASQLTKT